MESSVVLFKPRIHLFAALILLSPTRWIVMTGWRTSISLQPFVQTRCFFLYTSISLHPLFQTCLDYGYLSEWFLVCVHAPVTSPLFQTRLIVVACLFTSIRLESKWLQHGSDGDPTPRGVGFRLSPDLPSRPHQNEGDT